MKNKKFKLSFKQAFAYTDEQFDKLTKEQKRDVTGHLAELLIKKYYENQGYRVELSSDDFDEVKDITISKNEYHESIQVKGRYLHYQKQACSVAAKDWKHISKVNRLIFLVPPKFDNYPFQIIEVIDKNAHFPYTTKNGEEMIGWRLNVCKVLKTFKYEKLSKIFRKLSVSEYECVKNPRAYAYG